MWRQPLAFSQKNFIENIELINVPMYFFVIDIDWSAVSFPVDRNLVGLLRLYYIYIQSAIIINCTDGQIAGLIA